MANVPVTFAPGERIAHLGALVTAASTGRFSAGLDVAVSGSAIDAGLVELTRVRARPWSARLAPWQACGWEHALERCGRALRARLRAATPPPHHAEPESPRQLLALAVWIEIEGTARSVGEGSLVIEVSAAGDASSVSREEHTLRIEAAPSPVALSLYAAWDGALADRAEAIRPLLDDLARGTSSIEAAPRALAARGTARRTLYLRQGCVVLAPSGLAGDARFESLWEALAIGRVERLQFVPPARGALDVAVAQAPRVRDAPVEMVVSFDVRAVHAARDTVSVLLARVLERADCVAGFVAEHSFVSDLAALTPWERVQGVEPARTVAALRSRPRVDAREAIAYRGPA